MSGSNHIGDATEKVRKAKEVPCPDCYGGHFKPCNLCGDSGVALLLIGVALLLIEDEPKAKGQP